LIFIFAVNIVLLFSGICLNSLVVLTYWRSVPLRKKLCYFMIMVLSCCDLLAVLTTNPFTAYFAMLWLTGELEVYSSWDNISLDVSSFCLGTSLLALMVMNFDRYLATHYPLFHRTSVTKRKLLTLLGILVAILFALVMMGRYNFLISLQIAALILISFIVPSMAFINYNLFRIARKRCRNNDETRKTFSRKIISSCLLAVAGVLVLSIPTFVYAGLGMASDTSMSSENGRIARLWAKTFAAMNSTFNCLIFYWKNNILRTEGMKLIKSMKICRSHSEHYRHSSS
jgi:hypothetical protein